ncbi:hypothetical protein HK097_009652 [Rhizophlyctis rosea]|uniref:Uncharacterized protein n=1 Tax=Rhizophlyctis rosea TaxID=64517 RepID=A0AAD5S8L9_9FUNG|nr:hypothetical protein HK097_009652 [Rhizophlyctis rosea]
MPSQQSTESPPVGRTTAHQYSLTLEEDSTRPVPVTPPSGVPKRTSYFLTPPVSTPGSSPPPSPLSVASTEFASASDYGESGPLIDPPWEVVNSENDIQLRRKRSEKKIIDVDAEDEDDMVEVMVNEIARRLPKGVPVTADLLSVGRHVYLHIDGWFVKTDRRGVPLRKREVKADMKILVTPYPPMEPLALLYWSVGRISPNKHKVAKWLTSPWGRVVTNSAIAVLMSLMARPSLKGVTTIEVIISVVAGARMFDLLIKDTLIKLLSEALLTTSLLLFLLTTFQICFMIGASVPFTCLRHTEWHALPILLFTWLVIAPLLHRGWLWVGKKRRRGGGYWGWMLKIVAVYAPVLAWVAFVAWDVWGRAVSGGAAFGECRPLNSTEAGDAGGRAFVKIVDRFML